MPFYAVITPREDGDADCLAAFNDAIDIYTSKSALTMAKEFVQRYDEPEEPKIILIANVTDVLEEDYWTDCQTFT